MIKFGRTYKLTVQGQRQMHSIQLPLTCKFTVERHNFSMANTAHFTLYGLSESSRKDIYYDAVFQDHAISATFSAGYSSQPKPPIVFDGNVKFAYTTREGPELVTHIEALDGGFAMNQSTIHSSVGKRGGEILRTATLERALRTLIGVSFGGVFLNTEQAKLKDSAPVVLNGKTWEEIKSYIPEGAFLFIDKGVAYIIGKNLSVPSIAPLKISSSSGLLSIPQKRAFTVTCSMLFEPRFSIGQLVELTSDLAPWVNGSYVAIGFSHTGTISEVESGDCRTDATLLSTEAA